MLVNAEAHQWLYPQISLDGILVDSWFVNGRELLSLRITEDVGSTCRDRWHSRLFGRLQAAGSAYATFDLFEASSGEAAGTDNVRTHHQLYSRGFRACESGDPWSVCRDALEALPKDGLNSVFLRVTVNGDAYDMSRQITSHDFEGALECHLFVPEPSRCWDALNPCELHICAAIWSLLRCDNDLDILLAYLLDKGHVSQGEQQTPMDVVHELVSIGNLAEIEEVVGERGGIRVCSADYQFYKNCVLKLKDDCVPLAGNRVLAPANRAKLEAFAHGLEQQFGAEAVWAVSPDGRDKVSAG